MHIQHPQETIIKTYDFNGIVVDLIEWSDTVWCGKVGYADNNADEPNVEKIMEDFTSVSDLPNSREDHWDICMSLNYLSCERPKEALFYVLLQLGWTAVFWGVGRLWMKAALRRTVVHGG